LTKPANALYQNYRNGAKTVTNQEAYNVGIKIGRFLRVALVIAVLVFLIGAAYGNGKRQAEQIEPVKKIKLHKAKKKLATPEKIVINVYIENTERFLNEQSKAQF